MIKKSLAVSSRVLRLPQRTTQRRRLERRLHSTILDQIAAGVPAKPKYFQYKYFLERVIAAILLVPSIPVILFCGLLVRLNSPGPAIYRQQRVGMRGKEFVMLKIRTMAVDAESKSGPRWSTNNDPRINRLGRWLRFLHLDELPQLINVVKGDMTLVGPRPERPDFVNILNEYVDSYTERLVVKPGITGLAQIYLPPDETVDCVRKKICFDRAYIDLASPLLDLQIWFCTFVRVFGFRRGKGPKWIGLDKRFRNVIRKCENMQEDEESSGEFDLASLTATTSEIPQQLNGEHKTKIPVPKSLLVGNANGVTYSQGELRRKAK